MIHQNHPELIEGSSEKLQVTDVPLRPVGASRDTLLTLLDPNPILFFHIWRATRSSIQIERSVVAAAGIEPAT